MILPSKNISINNSLLGIGGCILVGFAETNAATVTELWENVKKINPHISFHNFQLALDFLFSIGAISLKNGLIYKSSEAKNVN